MTLNQKLLPCLKNTRGYSCSRITSIGVTKKTRGLVMSSQTIQQELELGIQTLGLNCSAYQQQQLLTYLEMLQRWNKAYNLTAIREPIQMVRLHLLDSLAIHPYIQGVKNIIDVGTGPGLPGIPLAILNPDINFTLLDSNGKKPDSYFKQSMIYLLLTQRR